MTLRHNGRTTIASESLLLLPGGVWQTGDRCNPLRFCRGNSSIPTWNPPADAKPHRKHLACLIELKQRFDQATSVLPGAPENLVDIARRLQCEWDGSDVLVGLP